MDRIDGEETGIGINTSPAGPTQETITGTFAPSPSPSPSPSSSSDKPFPLRVMVGIGSLPALVILLGHAVVDMYSSIVPSALGMIEKLYRLTPEQASWLLGAGSLASGLAQPVFAWLSDRTNRRAFGGMGLLLGAVCICSLDMANSPASLFLMYILGMVGVGMFHPIAVSTMGQLAGRARSLGISCFFVAGMIGSVLGAVLGSRMIAAGGLQSITWLMFPGIAIAWLLHFSISKRDHRSPGVHRAVGTIGSSRARWAHIAMLYLTASIRFTVNIGLVYLLVRLVEGRLGPLHPNLDARAISELAGPKVGILNGCMSTGMAIGGLSAGLLIPGGKEKWPMIVVPLVFAPAIAFLPQLPLKYMGLLTFAAGMAFASMVPITIALGQRILPHRTSLASGLMMGGAWAVALVGPRLAELILSRFGINAAFGSLATLLAISGVILIPMQRQLISLSSRHHTNG